MSNAQASTADAVAWNDLMLGGADNDHLDGGAGIAKTTNGAICAVFFGRIKREAANDSMPLAA